MEGILAVGGFWLCMMAIVLKKPAMAYIEKSRLQKSENEKVLEARVNQLEQAVATLGGNVGEIKETTEFAQRMMIESSKKLMESHQLLIESSQKLAVSSQSHIVQVQNAPNVQSQGTPSPFVPLLNAPVSNPPSQPKLLTDSAHHGKFVNEQTIRFERVLPASIERVWDYLTKSDLLASWLAVAEIEPTLGGQVKLHFENYELTDLDSSSKIRGQITSYEPRKRLSYSWIDSSSNVNSVVAFELSAVGNQTHLVVNHSELPSSRIHSFMASWHAHLDVLAARLQNVVPPSFPKRYKELMQTYALVATGAVLITGQSALAAGNSDAYFAVQAERSHLLSRHDTVSRDADALQRQIDSLKRDNSDESMRAISRLDDALKDEMRDLHNIELGIKDLDRALL